MSTENAVYSGTLAKANLKAGKFYNVTVLVSESEISYNKKYVVVCGVKWARGNLVYDPDYSGDEGFREHWRIAPYQWYFGGYDKTEKYSPYDEANGVKVRDHFIIGMLDTDAFADPEIADRSTDEGKLYLKDGTETKVFEYAKYGDLPYYESNGQFRLPNPSERKLLTEYASYQFGYVLTSNGTKVYGMLFTTPVGNRVTNLTEREIKESEMHDGLFLPCCDNLYGYGRTLSTYPGNPTITIDPKSYTLNNSSKEGYYWSTGTTTGWNGSKKNEGWGISGKGIIDNKLSGTFLEETSGNYAYYIKNKFLNAIRPIYCGEE